MPKQLVVPAFVARAFAQVLANGPKDTEECKVCLKDFEPVYASDRLCDRCRNYKKEQP